VTVEHAGLCTDPTGAEPIPDAPLLYVFPNNTFPSDSPNGASVFDGSSVGNNAVIRFEKGKTYRLRFINMSGMGLVLLPIVITFRSLTQHTF
jgi:hypothetical protein